MERAPRQNLNNINTGSSSQERRGGDMPPPRLERLARFFEIATRVYGRAEGANEFKEAESLDKNKGSGSTEGLGNTETFDDVDGTKNINSIKSVEGTRGSKNSVNNLIDKITPETALDVLAFLNSMLLNPDPIMMSEVAYGTETIRQSIGAGPEWYGQQKYIAPEKPLQVELFEKYLSAIKESEDRDQRALLAYYGINNLHLFKDGNGRTSRAVYLLIKNNSFLDDWEKLIHRRISDKSGRKNFLLAYNIKPAEEARSETHGVIQRKLVEKGYLDKKFGNTCFSVRSLSQYKGLVNLLPWVPGRRTDGMTIEDEASVYHALSDGTREEKYSTIAGLTLAMTLQEKRTLKEIARINTEKDGRHVSFLVNSDPFSRDINPSRKAAKVFKKLTCEDYWRMINNYRMLKRAENTILISTITGKQEPVF